MTNSTKTILAVATLVAIVMTAFLTRHRLAAENEAKATLSAAVEVDAARSGDIAAFFGARGPDDIEPSDVASFDGFPLYGASEAYQAEFGTLQRVTRLRAPSANPLQGLDAVRLTYGGCTPEGCQHHLTLVVGPSCMRPLPLVAEIAVRRETLGGDRDVFTLLEATVAAVEVPRDGDEISFGDGPEIQLFYAGDTVIEMHGGTLFATGGELVPLNAPARAASEGSTPPAPAPSQVPCAG